MIDTASSAAYWARADYPDSWGYRAAAAAKFVEPGSRVLDLGCGAPMYLKRHLPENCLYTPADLTRWTPDTIVVNLDDGEFPPGEHDYAAMLGVLEYLRAPDAALLRVRASCRHLLIGYYHRTPRLVRRVLDMLRPARGHRAQVVNRLSEPALRRLLADTGWKVAGYAELSPRRNGHHGVYLCAHASPAS